LSHNPKVISGFICYLKIDLTLISLLQGERLIVNKTITEILLTGYLYQDSITNKLFSFEEKGWDEFCYYKEKTQEHFSVFSSSIASYNSLSFF
jgi:hypothetical protein